MQDSKPTFPRGLGDSLTFRDFQQQTVEWRNANFAPGGGSDAQEQLLGMVEEGLDELLGVFAQLGKLSHHQIKMDQGIRGTREEHLSQIKDAVGDLLVYLTGFCQRNDLDLQDCAEYAWAQVKNRDWKKNPTTGEVD